MQHRFTIPIKQQTGEKLLSKDLMKKVHLRITEGKARERKRNKSSRLENIINDLPTHSLEVPEEVIWSIP